MRHTLTKTSIALVLLVGMAIPAYAHKRTGTDALNPKTKLDIRSYSVSHQRTMTYGQTEVTITGAITTASRFGNKVLRNGYLAMKFEVGNNFYLARISRTVAGFKGTLVDLKAPGKGLVGSIKTWRNSPKSMGFSFPKSLIGKARFRFSALSAWKGCDWCRDTTRWTRHRA